MALPDPDKFFDEPTDHSHWIESACFYLSIPERDLHGFIFYFFRPNLKLFTGGSVIWDESGQTVLDCLHYNFSPLQAYPENPGKFDFTASNTLQVETLEAAKRYRLRYDFGGTAFDLTWQATSDVHVAPQAYHASYHSEQTGRMTGEMTIEGEKFAVDCVSLRDISFGVREYAQLRPGAYCWGSDGARTFQTLGMGTEREQKILSGFLDQDGQCARLADGIRRIDTYGPYGASTVTIEAVDTLGRELRVTGRLKKGLLFSGNSTHTVVWSQTDWQWNGEPCIGDNQEFYPAQMFRQIIRGEVSVEAL